MRKTMTTAEFISKVNARNPGYSKQYDILGEYSGSRCVMTVRHRLCGNSFRMDAAHIMRGQGCPKCNGCGKRSTESFMREVALHAGDEYSVLGEYVNAHTKIRMRHEPCGTEFEMRPDDFLRGRRCPKCGKRNGGRKRHEDAEKRKMLEDYYDGASGEGFMVLGRFTGSKNGIKVLHMICGHTFDVPKDDLIEDELRCPYCSRKRRR